MAHPRRYRVMLWAALLAQPACAVVREPEPQVARRPGSPVAPGMVSTQPATEFATLIRGPGERLPVHDPDTGPEPRTMSVSLSQPAGPAPVGDDVPPTPEEPRFLPAPPPDPPLVAAVRAYSEQRPEQAVEYLKGLKPANQELMLQLIPVLVRGSQIDMTRAGPTELGLLAEPLESAAAALSSRAPLMLAKAHFTRSVRDFGRYDPLPERHPFPPGAAAELYIEVRNVPSEPNGEGFVTKLACSLQVRDGNGAVVELLDRNRRPVPALTETKQDFTRSPIRDYFLLFRFPVPAKPGSYAVTVEVSDPASGRAVSRTMPLRVQ